MTNIFIPGPQIVSGACLLARTHQISSLQLWVSPKVSILTLYRSHQKYEATPDIF